MYKHFGKEVLRSIVDKKKEEAVSEEELERLYQLVYDNFIEEIDAIDNGGLSPIYYYIYIYIYIYIFMLYSNSTIAVSLLYITIYIYSCCIAIL